MSENLTRLGLGAGAQEEDIDVLGGYQTLDSDAYTVKLGICYLGVSKKGATSVTITYSRKDREYSETIYVTNRNGETTYTKHGKSHPLPGWSQVNAICNIATGKGIENQANEKRTIKQRDPATGKDKNVEVVTLVDLIGKTMVFGILRVHENKTVLRGTSYVPTNEKRTYNRIDLQANEKGFTYNEIKKGAEKPEFIARWLKANKGKDLNRFKPVAEENTIPSTTPNSEIDFED